MSAALSMDVGDAVHVHEVDEQGWAVACMENGREGWLPFAICERRWFSVQAPLAGEDGAGLLLEAAGDRQVPASHGAISPWQQSSNRHDQPKRYNDAWQQVLRLAAELEAGSELVAPGVAFSFPL